MLYCLTVALIFRQTKEPHLLQSPKKMRASNRARIFSITYRNRINNNYPWLILISL
jgi:hypothetical protein